LPPEAEPALAWAAGELAARKRTQADIHAEFCARLAELAAERPDLDVPAPSLSAFNRYSMRLHRLNRRLAETRDMVAALADRFDPAASDDLTVIAAETIKALVLHLLSEADDGEVAPKDAMLLASAFQKAVQAQAISSDRRARLEREFAARVAGAVETVAGLRGLSGETAEAIKAQILGVRA
jgi:Skp family chaperone for outer membrane proteins